MRRANPRSSTPDWRTRWNVAGPTKASVGRRMSPNMEKATPVFAAVATSPRAIRPPDTAPRNTLARPTDSEIVALRAPCSVKCSVVTNVTAPARRSLSARSGLLPQCHCCPGTSASDRAGRLPVETGLTRPPRSGDDGLDPQVAELPRGQVVSLPTAARAGRCGAVLVAGGTRCPTRRDALGLGNAPLGAPAIRNHIGGAPSNATPRLCGRVSLGDGLDGNQSRHLVLELLGDTSTPALGHRLRERLGEDVVFSVLYTVEDRLRYRLR